MSNKQGRIIAAAGTNGAGKSTIVGGLLAQAGGAYFNPDIYAHRLVAAGYPQNEANGEAWVKGYNALREAIDNNMNFAFETTLGGSSVTMELLRALALGRQVTIYYIGLSSPELHIQRVVERVARGGHDIPEDKIRERYRLSRENLLRFIGTDATLRVWDNSQQNADGSPAAAEVFRVQDRKLIIPKSHALEDTIEWARPLLSRALVMYSRC